MSRSSLSRAPDKLRICVFYAIKTGKNACIIRSECTHYASTLQFFWLGRKLFGGRFIRFMSGPKNESDILTGSSTPNRFLFVSLAVIQAIYKHCISKCFFVKSQCQSPFPLSLESWHLLKVGRVFISFMFKSVNWSILQKTIYKTSKSPHAFAMCSIRTDLLKQENEKIDSL